MYARMMMVSRRLQETLDAAAAGDPVNSELVEQARTELYRGQCNCSYWHGAFGGIYLPHLRNAVYQHLIAADNLLDRAIGRPETWIEATADDFNFDARQEVRLANDKLMALVAPSRGGQLLELDVRRIQHNLLATLARRPEAYHQKVLAGQHQQHDQVASIHDRVVFKQPEPRPAAAIRRPRPQEPARPVLRQRCDARSGGGGHGRRSGATSSAASTKPASAAIPTASRCNCSATETACGVPVRITKGLTLDAGSSTLQVAYLLENLPADRPLHFAVEFNFAGLPANAYGRNFSDIDGKILGQLGTKLDLTNAFGLGLTDEWLGIDVGLKMSRPTNFWTFPIETVSQSEGGFELIHQSVVVHAALAGRSRQGRPLERDDADVAGHQPRREQPPRRSRGGQRVVGSPWGVKSRKTRWGGSCTATPMRLSPPLFRPVQNLVENNCWVDSVGNGRQGEQSAGSFSSTN